MCRPLGGNKTSLVGPDGMRKTFQIQMMTHMALSNFLRAWKGFKENKLNAQKWSHTGFLVSLSHPRSSTETQLSTAACNMELATSFHELSFVVNFYSLTWLSVYRDYSASCYVAFANTDKDCLWGSYMLPVGSIGWRGWGW